MTSLLTLFAMVAPRVKTRTREILLSFQLAVLGMSAYAVKRYPVSQYALSDASGKWANNEIAPSLFPFL